MRLDEAATPKGSDAERRSASPAARKAPPEPQPAGAMADALARAFKHR
jgi:hypothetical protein